MNLCSCRSAGKFRIARTVLGSILAVIRLTVLKCLTKVNLKKWASGNYVLPCLEHRHCAFLFV